MLLTENSLTFKGIKPLQRLGATARNFSFNNPFAELFLAYNIPESLDVVPPDPWPGKASLGRDIISGVFSFHGQTISKNDLSWNPREATPEWFAKFHSFEWLRDLRSVGGERARRMAREMLLSWADKHSKYDEASWRADILGTRIKSWIAFYDFFCSSADDDFKSIYFTSLMRQTSYLSKFINSQNLSGIPLMHALRGLAYAGIALEKGEDYLEQAFAGVLDQVREQIMPDGGHVSRNPQACFEFLHCLVDLRAALISAQIEIPEELQHAIDRIAPAVKLFRHGDGALMHLNGSQEMDSSLCDSILMHSGAYGGVVNSLPHSGYERLSQGRSILVMDTGASLVSKYSERAHAGALSFEYSFGRERVIVNCGTSAVKGKWRELLRSTPAHSTLSVDSSNSCQFGKDEGLVSNPPIVNYRRSDDNKSSVVEAAHSGYMTRFGLNHHRSIKMRNNGEVIRGEDQLSGRSGVSFAIRFHLHPDIKASLVKSGDEVWLSSKSGANWSFKVKGGKVSLEESVYLNENSIPRRSQQIVFEDVSAGANTVIGWEMSLNKQ